MNAKPEIRIPIPKVGFTPPVYYCKRATMPHTLDGRLDKDFWKDAPFTEYFQDIEGPTLPEPRFRTRAKMLWDDENLYIGAILEGDEIWGHQTEHDCVIFHDNDFEIFLDTNSDTQEYIEYEMNAKNTTWDLLLTKAYRDQGSPINGLEVKGLKSAVYIDGTLNDSTAQNKYWSVEVVIPFTTLAETADSRKAPVAGDFYRLNFSRVQWDVTKGNGTYQKVCDPATGRPNPESNWVWAPTGVINIHYPELWGFLFFCTGDETPSIPETEVVKWELRKLYYAEQIYFDYHGGYTDDVNTLAKILQDFAPASENQSYHLHRLKVQVTDHFFELSATTKDHTRTVLLFADGKTQVKEG
ncbi:MAG: carbohydrate-binding family 9-like protein [Lachnospiraceae bacterium]|nr:carbohydrate-binding family 9-like protein [Lachnospiraceae bacterium]